MIEKLLAAGASFDDGARYSEAAMICGMRSPIEWVEDNLAELLGLLPLEAKPIFHSPHAQGGNYFTLLECIWGDPELLNGVERLGMEMRMTVHEAAELIRRGKYEAFCNLVGRLGEEVKNEALARVQKEWPDFGSDSRGP
jgi:hypothetical protein